VRGGEQAHIVRDLHHWSTRFQDLAQRLGAELRWTPQLDELRLWIEEYRVSLYAQELKTLGPISTARLEQRAAEIDAWLCR
jgi:ATP-dependent helicase HrpA